MNELHKSFNSSYRLKNAGVLAIAIALAAPLTSPIAQAQPSKDFVANMESYLKSDNGRETVGLAMEKYFKDRQAEEVKKREEAIKKQEEENFKNRVDVTASGSPSKGATDPQITIYEFSDFECPFCSRGQETMEQVLKKYDGKVKLIFKNYPLPFHQNAIPAAKAALAAHEQGKFWEFHDVLFQNQRGLNEELFVNTAKELGLDVEKFKSDMKSEKIQKQLDADQEEAKKVGVRGTPLFVVNGVKVSGAQPITEFSKLIDRLIKEKAGK